MTNSLKQMQDKENKYRIVVGLLAHVDAGKTTLAEGLLYTCGQLRSLGRVDHRDTFLDTNEMERQRGITIFSKQALLQYGNLDITMLDTPGHVDFSAEMERTLQVLDLAVLVISGADGVQGHTQTLWKLLERYQVPTMIFVNKMDQPGTNADSLLAEIQKLSPSCVDVRGLKSHFCVDEGGNPCTDLEDFCVMDAQVEQFLETGMVSLESVRETIADRAVFPVFFGSALKLEGLDELLTGMDNLTPIPEYEDSFAARVYKIGRDENGNRLSYMKVTGGCLRAKMMIPGLEEKADQLRRYDGVKYSPLSVAEGGEIVAVTGLVNTFAGQGLGAETEETIPVLEPVLVYCLKLPDEIDAMQAMPFLKQLEEEEPELHVVWKEELREIHVQVMGQVQTDILKKQILDRFGWEVSLENGRIIYKETIAESAYGIGHFEPLRHYAEVQLLLEPGEAGSGIVFASVCSEDILDKNWQRLIRTHVEETIHPGVLTGSEVTDLRIALVCGRAHPKHTEGGDFRQATYRAIRNGLRQAKSVLLEPFYSFSMELPTNCLGRAMTDIERMQGSMDSPESDAEGMSHLSGRVPVRTFGDYQKELAAYTAGRGTVNCKIAEYGPCKDAEQIVAERGYDPEADLRRPTGSVFCAHGAGYQVPWDQVADLAHVEPPASLGIRRCAHQEPDAQNLPYKGPMPGSISLEEIDAIFANLVHKREQDHKAYRRYHRSMAKTVYASPSKASSESRGTFSAAAPKMLLVDGYNVIFAWEELRALAETNIDSARDRLIDICCDYQGFFGGDLILVFDAYKVRGGTEHQERHNNIFVVYTKEAETADAYIERTTHKLASQYRITVATSDRLEQMIIWGNGATRMSSPEFEQAVKSSHETMRETLLDKESALGNRPFADIQIHGTIAE